MQAQELVNTKSLIAFFTLFHQFLKYKNKALYDCLNFPDTDNIDYFRHRVPVSPKSSSLLAHHGIDTLSFSLPPDQGTMVLNIAFFAGKKIVYLDKYGLDSYEDTRCFDVYDFNKILEYLVASFNWIVGEKQPDDSDASDDDSNTSSDDSNV